MDLISIPKNLPDLSMSHVLDGTEYTFHFKWNMRGGWFLELSDAAGSPLFNFRRMVVGVDLLTTVRHDDRCPTGQLLLVDFSNTDTDPGYLDLVAGTEDDLQGRVGLIYVPLNDPDLAL